MVFKLKVPTPEFHLFVSSVAHILCVTSPLKRCASAFNFTAMHKIYANTNRNYLSIITAMLVLPLHCRHLHTAVVVVAQYTKTHCSKR